MTGTALAAGTGSIRGRRLIEADGARIVSTDFNATTSNAMISGIFTEGAMLPATYSK